MNKTETFGAGDASRSFVDKDNVIYLRERSMAMLKKDLILRNPLRILGNQEKDPIKEGEFGAVLAKAGVGKTAFLVQLALSNLLKEKNVLHVSLTQPVRKVCLWYEEVFHNIANEYNLKNTSELWDTILPHRFIMTFNVDDFSVAKLEERLNDLTEQGIFFPQLVIIDGLPINDESREPLAELKILAREMGFPIWFAITVGPEDGLEPAIVPASIESLSNLFEILIGLKAIKGKINVMVLKGDRRDDAEDVFLDPSTLLIKNRE